MGVEEQSLDILEKLIDTNILVLIWLAPLALAGAMLVMVVFQGRQDRGNQLVLLKTLEIFGTVSVALQSLQTAIAGFKDAQVTGIQRHEDTTRRLSEMIEAQDQTRTAVEAMRKSYADHTKLQAETLVNLQTTMEERIRALETQQGELMKMVSRDPDSKKLCQEIEQAVQQAIRAMRDAEALAEASSKGATA